MGIIHKIAECTKLAAEYSSLPCNAESLEAYASIRARKKELKTRIEKLKAEIARYREEEPNYDSADNGNDQGSSTLEEGSNLELQDVLTMLEISRMDRIAETLESIDRSLKALTGCIGSGGGFCITGDIISSDC